MKIVLIFLWSFNFGNCLNARFNKSEYHQMPKIFRFDDYDQCMGIYSSEALYCVVNTFIKPDAKSELYKYIKDFSSNKKQHFRHDKLQRGVCVNGCRSIIDKMGKSSNDFLVKKFPFDSKLNFEFVHYFNAAEHRAQYDDDVNKCVNFELMNRYNLSGYSTIEYCIKADMTSRLDWMDILTALIFLSIFFLVVFSSFYDRVLRNSIYKMKEDHYKSQPLLKLHQILTLFSIRRNWYILSAPAKTEVRDLRFIQAVRALTMFGVIIGHCGWFSIILPSNNPIFIEDIYSNVSSMLVVNGINIVQTFFVIGGFLTAYLFAVNAEKDKNSSWISLFKATLLRYIRFAPLLLLTILAHATWLYRIGNGPLWDKVNFAERQFCRKNWWINMLFLDNYVKVDQKCLIHSWYLAADFWLSFFAVFIMILINKKPNLKFWIFSLIFGASAAITASVTYVKMLDPVAIFSPETLRNMHFITNETDPKYFKDFYAPTHMNIGNYFIGVLTGLIYFNLKAQNRNLSKSFCFRISWYLCIFLGFVTILSAYFFYTNDFPKPSLTIALISVVLKHSWGVIGSVGAIGVVFKYGWFIPNIANYSGWRILGRISYATFICHLFVLKVLMSGVHQPLYLSVFNIMCYVCAVFGISNVIGLILTLSVEVPVSSLCKMLFLKRDDKETDRTNDVNMKRNTTA